MGEEKRMVVESPMFSLEKLVKINNNRNPPVKASKKRKNEILSRGLPRNEDFLYLAMEPYMISCKTPLITNTCIGSMS